MNKQSGFDKEVFGPALVKCSLCSGSTANHDPECPYRLNEPDFEDGPEFEGWEERAGLKCPHCSGEMGKHFPHCKVFNEDLPRVLGSKELEFLIRLYNDSITKTWITVSSGMTKLQELGLIDLSYPDEKKVHISVNSKGKKHVNRLCKIPLEG